MSRAPRLAPLSTPSTAPRLAPLGTCDILIVGAGPVGLTLACDLARRGVGFRLIDSRPAIPEGSRATDIHARTLEIFDDLGIGEEVVARGKKVTCFSSYYRGESVLDLSLEGLPSARPYAIALPQEDTERILARRLVELGGSIERGVTATDVSSQPDGVVATLRHADGSSERARCRWLVGCDGTHSRVRRAAGIRFEGTTFRERYLVVDTELDWDLPHDRVHLFTAPGGFVNVLAMPGPRRVRILANLPAGAPDDLVRAMNALVRERVGRPMELGPPSFVGTFRISQRLASHYRRGRILLAGDAAHTWSPLLGQGMNVGIQDAYNLGWKLALDASGAARSALLDSYVAERRPVARMVLMNTHLMHTLSTLRTPLAAAVRDLAVRAVAMLPGTARVAAAACSELATHYRASPIVGGGAVRLRYSGNVQLGSEAQPGDRAPHVATAEGDLCQTLGLRHTLLLFFGDDARAARSDRAKRALEDTARRVALQYDRHVSIVCVSRGCSIERADGERPLSDGEGALHRAFRAERGAMVLIRPDRHIEFRAGAYDGERLLRHMARLFELGPRPRASWREAASVLAAGVPGLSLT